jgi:serralysin
MTRGTSAGIDRALDFSVAQGHRVQLDPGTTCTVAQLGADTVINSTTGSVVLVGVAMSGLLRSSVSAG